MVNRIKYYQASDRRRGVVSPVSQTEWCLKALLPVPYIIGRHMWHPEHSKKACPTPKKLMVDCVPILRQEMEKMCQAGADTA